MEVNTVPKIISVRLKKRNMLIPVNPNVSYRNYRYIYIANIYVYVWLICICNKKLSEPIKLWNQDLNCTYVITQTINPGPLFNFFLITFFSFSFIFSIKSYFSLCVIFVLTFYLSFTCVLHLIFMVLHLIYILSLLDFSSYLLSSFLPSSLFL